MDNKDLIDKLIQSASYIEKASRQSSYGNYIVTSSQTAQMIQEIFSENRSNWRKEKINKIYGTQ